MNMKGKLPERRWIQDFRCGCGECRFKKNVQRCPHAANPKAIML